MNQWIDQYFRYYINHFQDDWDEYFLIVDYTQNMLLYDSIGFIPYEVVFGIVLRIFYNWEAWNTEFKDNNNLLNRTNAQKYIARIYEAWELAYKGFQDAQAWQVKQANKKRREPDFDIKDMVYILIKGQIIDWLSRKLAAQNDGFFEILEKIRYLYRLILPDRLKIYDIFHVDRFWKARIDAFLGQKEEILEGIIVEDEFYQEVEKILSSCTYYRKF